MISYHPIREAVEIIDRMLAALMTGMPMTGSSGSDLRRIVGKLKAGSEDSIKAATIGTDLQTCFDAALAAGATLTNMDNVRIAMLNETPRYYIGAAVASTAIVFTLVEQTRMITAMTFVSRADASMVMDKMIEIFDTAKLAMSNMMTGLNYEYTVALCASLIQHLAASERQLPRIVDYTLPVNLPSLTIANFLYADATRSDEIINENKVVHPAFCPRSIVALSE